MNRVLFTALSSVIVGLGALVAVVFLWLTPPVQGLNVSGEPSVKRGAYLARIAGCVACHTSTTGAPLAGGPPLKTKFGTFYAPNITPDPQFGIGRWTPATFARAIRHGISPDGDPYYPAFPFAFYAALNDQDIADLWAALNVVPAAAVPSQPHELSFPFGIRDGLRLWRAAFLDPTSPDGDPSRSDAWNRGKFIVEGPAHCGACHTPRNFAAARIAQQTLAGDPDMLDGGASPAITAAALSESGWTRESLVRALKSGIMPGGDVLGGSMAEVVKEGTSHLLPLHLDDVATFLLDER